MLYLGIDQHAKQLTISLRNDHGDVILKRQVSTEPKRCLQFLAKLQEKASEEGYIAIVEVCGFNDWLIETLRKWKCREIALIHPEKPSKKKTDRRDAATLSELLWVNRDRLVAGKPVRGLRQVDIASTTDQENRRLTTLRKEARQSRTRTINKIKHILRRYNLQWEMPTKTFPTKAAVAWLKKLVLPEIDRLEMDHLLSELERVQQRMGELEQVIAERCASSDAARGRPPCSGGRGRR